MLIASKATKIPLLLCVNGKKQAKNFCGVGCATKKLNWINTMINYLIGFCAAFLLIGCTASPQEIAEMQAENKQNSNNPRLIAITPQGKLYLIFVRPYPKNLNHYDRVYFFDTSSTVSVNAEEGKWYVTETSVIVNVPKF